MTSFRRGAPRPGQPDKAPDQVRNAATESEVPVWLGRCERVSMFASVIVRIVEASARRAWLVLAIGVLLAIGSGYYAAKHFAINTNTDDLISSTLPWRQSQIAFDKTFPQLYQRILVVIDGRTPELAQSAADRLAAKLASNKDEIAAVDRTEGLPFFRRNALLFEPTAQVGATVHGMLGAQPLLASLTADPSQRGLLKALGMLARGAEEGAVKLENFSPLLNPLSQAYQAALDGRPDFFSWQSILGGAKPIPQELRQFLNIKPVMDYSDLEPGHKATQAIRNAAASLGLDPAHGVRVRLTGDVPLNDQEFVTVRQGAALNTTIMVLVVAFLLWAALRSPKIVFAILISVAIGLAITAALGLAMVGALNLISIAFAVLFVGIGADFGIQFSVRYRAERHAVDDLAKAISLAGARAGRPLALAAAATTCGFYAFLPTVYKGVSELGLIAGTGMIIAFIMSVTVLPALLTLFKPPSEDKPIGYAFLAPADRFLARHRYGIVIGTLVAVLAASPLLLHLRFDFNPLNLNSDTVQSVSTLKDLMKDPSTTYNTIDVVAANPAAADALAAKLAKLPQVARVTTLQSFVPTDQSAKLAILKPAAQRLAPLFARPPAPPLTDAELRASLSATSTALEAAAAKSPGPGGEPARRFAGLLNQMSGASPSKRAAATAILIPPLKVALAALRDSLQASRVTLASIPSEIRRQWQTPDGRTRVEVAPKGDPNSNAVIRRFTRAVTAVAPEAAGAPIAIQGAGDTVVKAFMEAGFLALLSISLLLYAVLRRVSDVLLTLVPLLLAGAVTLEICVAIGLRLNFANIIALPLLLGLGVAFKIYFVMAWRAGVTNLLQSSLTRAVFFSALVTATAFGSLWLSKNPGTSSMGKLLALSLICTLAAAVLFQPALMGPPRAKEGEEVI